MFLLFFGPRIFWWNTFNILCFVDFTVLLVLFMIPFDLFYCLVGYLLL
jgi:hypothetical protein